MSETYIPRVGDRVRFYSWAADMDLYGEVLSVASAARMATVRTDDEEGETFMKSWDTLHLVEGYIPARAWDQALVNRLRDERDEAIKRAEKAETAYDHVSDMADRLTRERNDARAAGEALRRVVEKHNAETWTDHDGTVRPLGGITRAALARQMYDENERAGQEHQRAQRQARELTAKDAKIRELKDKLDRILRAGEECDDQHASDLVTLKHAEARAAAWWEAAKAYCRADRLTTETAQRYYDQIQLLKARQASIAQERNDWAVQAGWNSARAGVAEKRAEELEAELAELKAALKTLSN